MPAACIGAFLEKVLLELSIMEALERILPRSCRKLRIKL